MSAGKKRKTVAASHPSATASLDLPVGRDKRPVVETAIRCAQQEKRAAPGVRTRLDNHWSHTVNNSKSAKALALVANKQDLEKKPLPLSYLALPQLPAPSLRDIQTHKLVQQQQQQQQQQQKDKNKPVASKNKSKTHNKTKSTPAKTPNNSSSSTANKVKPIAESKTSQAQQNHAVRLQFANNIESATATFDLKVFRMHHKLLGQASRVEWQILRNAQNQELPIRCIVYQGKGKDERIVAVVRAT